MPADLATYLVPAGLSVLGGLLGSAVAGGEPAVPNLVDPEANSRRQKRAQTERSLDRQFEELTEEFAAGGLTGAPLAAAEQVVSSGGTDALALLDAEAADRLADAEQQERLAEYQRAIQRRESRAQGVGNILSQLGQTFVLDQILNPATATA